VSSIYGRGAWRNTLPGPAFAGRSLTDGLGAVTIGQRFFAGSSLSYDPDVKFFQARSGAWEIVDTGETEIINPGQPDQVVIDHYVIVRRPDDAHNSAGIYHGVQFAIESGDTYANTIMRLTTDADPVTVDTTELHWTNEPIANLSSATAALVDASRLGTAMATMEGFTADVTSAADVDLGTVNTPAGLPGVAVIPAGQWLWQLFAQLTADAPAATTTIRGEVSHVLNVPGVGDTITELGTFETGSIHATDFAAFGATQNVAASVSISPLETLRVRFLAHTTSATPVRVQLVFNDSDHTTRVQTTMMVGYAGTTVHNELTGREVAATATPGSGCHPASSIGPGRFHTPFDADVATASGKLTAPDRNVCRVTGTEDLIGIATAGWFPGDCLDLTFTQARKLIHAGSPGTGFAPLRLLKVSASISDRNVQLSGESSIRLQLTTGSAAWEQKTPVVYSPS
jgi:hypothetical protein